MERWINTIARLVMFNWEQTEYGIYDYTIRYIPSNVILPKEFVEFAEKFVK